MLTVQDAYSAGISSAFNRFKLANMKDMLAAAQMKGVAKTHPALRNPATFMTQGPTSASVPMAPAASKKTAAYDAGVSAALEKFGAGWSPILRGVGRDALRGALPGAVVGGIQGALSDDGSFLGGAAKGGLAGGVLGGVGGNLVRRGVRAGHAGAQAVGESHPDYNPVSWARPEANAQQAHAGGHAMMDGLPLTHMRDLVARVAPRAAVIREGMPLYPT